MLHLSHLTSKFRTFAFLTNDVYEGCKSELSVSGRNKNQHCSASSHKLLHIMNVGLELLFRHAC